MCITYQQVKVYRPDSRVRGYMATRREGTGVRRPRPVCRYRREAEGRGGPSGPSRPYGLPVWVPAGQGTSPGHGSFTIWLLQNHKLTKRSGRRAPILEGGGHSCLFVSSDGDAARECASINQSSRDRTVSGTLGGSSRGITYSPQHARQPVQVLTFDSVQDS